MAKKKSDIPQSLNGLMRPDLPFDESSLTTHDFGAPAPQAKTPDYSAQLAEMQANLKRMEEANLNLQRTNMALMGQPVQQQPNFGPEAVDLENLPDPVTDPKGYAAEIVRRGDAVLQARQQKANWQSQQQQDLTSKVDGIWERFAKEHEDYAGNSDLVEFAATKAVAAAKAQGMDVNKYMFSATPAFFGDVVKILDGLGVGKTSAGEEEDNSEPATRTAGIPGGLESGGALTRGKDADEQRIPTLAEELRGWKEKTGFYA
jgi:hypothetical protein